MNKVCPIKVSIQSTSPYKVGENGMKKSMYIIIAVNLIIFVYNIITIHEKAELNKLLDERTNDYLSLLIEIKKLNSYEAQIKKNIKPFIKNIAEFKSILTGQSIPKDDKQKDPDYSIKDTVKALKILNRDMGLIQQLLKSYKELFKNVPSIFPVLGSQLGKGYVVSNYGWRRDPFTYKMTLHEGVDIINLPGTPIVSSADGLVLSAKHKDPIKGKYIEIKHKYGWTTVYQHLQTLKVETGDRVKKGQIIGLLGKSGKTTGPHLYYEVRINNEAIDPSPYIRLDKYWRFDNFGLKKRK